jgi:hypothetical protein
MNFQRLSQAVNDVRMLQQNPGNIGKYLADHGMINPSQAADIQSMNPSQIGQYLMNNGIISQQQVQSMIPTIRNM